MKKALLFLWIFCLGSGVYAQIKVQPTKITTKMGKAKTSGEALLPKAGKAIPPVSNKAPVLTNGVGALYGKNGKNRAAGTYVSTQATQKFARMAQVVSSPYKPATSAQGNIPRKTWLTNDTGAAYTNEQAYQQAMQKFDELKKDAGPFLYYQAKSGESHTLPPSEVRYWTDRVSQVRQELAALRLLGVSTDNSIDEAYKFLNYLMETVAPASVPFTPTGSFKIAERVFDENEFFLRDPVPENCVKRLLSNMGMYCGSVPELPENLDIVIFNDYDGALYKFETARKNGKFFPENAKIHIFSKLEDLRQYTLTQRNFPDVLITDLTTDRGLEGALFAQDLRQAGYKGGLVALAGYNSYEMDTESLLMAGFDGMIPYFEHKDLAKGVVKSIQNYFYYRDLHGWTR